MVRSCARRTFLKLVAASGAAASLRALPGCAGHAVPPAKDAARFFSAGERATVEALAEAIVPEDRTVGALGADAVEYIDRFLETFDNPVPTLYRGGPFSGRTPYPDPRTGEPSDRYPDNHFLEIPRPGQPVRQRRLDFPVVLGLQPDVDHPGAGPAHRGRHGEPAQSGLGDRAVRGVASAGPGEAGSHMSEENRGGISRRRFLNTAASAAGPAARLAP